MCHIFENQILMAKRVLGTKELRAKEKSSKRRERRKQELKKIPPKELLSLLPKEMLESIAEQTGVDVQVKHLFAPMLVYLFILAILEDEDSSLQSLTDLYNSPQFSFFSGKGGHKTAKSSLSDRLASINCEFFKNLHAYYIEALQAKYGKALKKKDHDITRFDSTMVSLCAALTEIGMTVGAKPKKGEGKVQIKVSLGLKGFLPKTVKVFTDQAHLSEEKALKEAIEFSKPENDGAITFDMGLKSRKTLQCFDNDGRFFTTRLNSPRYEVVRPHKQIKGRTHGNLCFESDEIVYLFQSGGQDSILQHEFRLIKAVCRNGRKANETFYFLTNIMDMTTFEITDIYRRRWDIEVFFRFLKQYAGLRSLLSTKENGITAVMYLRLIVGTMIWTYINVNELKEYKRAKSEFKRAVQWEIDLLIGRLIGNRTLVEAKLYLLDFQGIIKNNTT